MEYEVRQVPYFSDLSHLPVITFFKTYSDSQILVFNKVLIIGHINKRHVRWIGQNLTTNQKLLVK